MQRRSKEAQYLFIVNPVAGRGRTKGMWVSLEKQVRGYRLPYEVSVTRGTREAEAFAAQGVKDGFDCVVAVGGDGTAHEVANGILTAGSRTPVAVVPTGGGNDFCKAIGVPLSPKEALDVLVYGERRRLDVGLINDRYFVNGLGIGLDGAVSYRYRGMRHLQGELGYLWGAVHEALTFQGFPVEVVTAEWRYGGPALLVGATNGQFQGGDFKLAPQARVDDGLLDVYVFHDMTPLKRLVRIPRVRKGAHLGLKEVEIRRAPWVELTLDRPLPAHMDGESFTIPPGRTRIETVSARLEVLARPATA